MEKKFRIMKEIPIVQCFDHNYVLPAGVAFQSLLEHAKSQDVKYLLHVIGTGLTDGDKDLLRGIVVKFPHANIFFHEPPKLDLPEYKTRGNLSRDVFYKMSIPDILPQYDVVIVSDVDVMYADDIASFRAAIHIDENCYLCGTEDVGYAAWRGRGILRDVGIPRFFGRYERQMTPDEREKLTLGAGFMLMNSRKCREDGMPEKWMSFARNNFHRLVLLEQDVMNICCAPAVKVVSSRFMAIAGYEPAYRNLSDSDRTANPAWDEMFAHPVSNFLPFN